jgi:DNA-binding LacI/PurR family transcriptional regulator
MLRYLEIKQNLLEMISSMPNGYRLPPRRQLCKMLDTTQATLGKAIAELIDEDILFTKEKSGTFVVRQLDGAQKEMENWTFIFPFLNYIYSELLLGIREIAEKRNTNLILCETGESLAKQESFIKRMVKANVEGFIIVPPHSSDVSRNIGLYSALTASEVPFVFCNRSVEGVNAPVIRSNDFFGGYIATKYLLARGYRSLAYVSRLPEYRTNIERCQGYIAALQEHGKEINRQLIVFPEKTNISLDQMEQDQRLDNVCKEKMCALLDANAELDGVICFNDETAACVYSAVQASNRQVGVIGYDNSKLCALLDPPLTSIDYRSRENGRMAATVLVKLIEGAKISGFSHYLLLPSIVERSSCPGPNTN